MLEAYRLEIGTKLQINEPKIYMNFGVGTKDSVLSDSNTLINLASNEYYKVLGNIAEVECDFTSVQR